MNAITNDSQDDCHSVSSAGSTYLELYPRGTELVVNDPQVLHSVMVGLRTLIERFKITWKESVETIGLVNCLAFVLENTSMDARVSLRLAFFNWILIIYFILYLLVYGASLEACPAGCGAFSFPEYGAAGG